VYLSARREKFIKRKGVTIFPRLSDRKREGQADIFSESQPRATSESSEGKKKGKAVGYSLSHLSFAKQRKDRRFLLKRGG